MRQMTYRSHGPGTSFESTGCGSAVLLCIESERALSIILTALLITIQECLCEYTHTHRSQHPIKTDTREDVWSQRNGHSMIKHTSFSLCLDISLLSLSLPVSPDLLLSLWLFNQLFSPLLTLRPGAQGEEKQDEDIKFRDF